MTEHTPGPWLLDDDDLSISAQAGSHICTVTDVQSLPCVEAENEEAVQAECLANARLIAAAPDLFNGCKALLGLLQLINGRDDMPPLLRDAINNSHRVDEAAAALAKAQQP